jgi:hypothetical protein
MSSNVKTFSSDDSVLDPAIKSHISSLYAAVDNKDLDFWGSHFTENAELKKGATNVRGRASMFPPRERKNKESLCFKHLYRRC